MLSFLNVDFTLFVATLFLLVDAAPAPNRMGGIPRTRYRKAAAKQEIFAVVPEKDDSILCWKHWDASPPSAFKVNQIFGYFIHYILKL